MTGEIYLDSDTWSLGIKSRAYPSITIQVLAITLCSVSLPSLVQPAVSAEDVVLDTPAQTQQPVLEADKALCQQTEGSRSHKGLLRQISQLQ